VLTKLIAKYIEAAERTKGRLKADEREVTPPPFPQNQNTKIILLVVELKTARKIDIL